MHVVFPCGAKGREEFCPNVCQYGKFCKIAKTKKPEQNILDEEECPIEEVREKPRVKFYY